MSQVTVTINDRDYEIACDDGQENHLIKLSQFVDKRLELFTIEKRDDNKLRHAKSPQKMKI